MVTGIVAATLILLILALGQSLAQPSLGRRLRDASFRRTLPLPNGAATTTAASPIDLGPRTQLGARTLDCEFELVAPALTTGQLADGATMKYDVILSDNADLSSPTVPIPSAIVQTGAGGAGAATVTYYFRLPSNVAQYLGFRATNSGAGDASAATATLDALF